MLFREFNIIAAAAYAAQWAADGCPEERSQWDDLDPEQQVLHVQRVTAIARHEVGDSPDAFDVTAAAILGYNNGQGGLALEELARIGEAPFNLGLVTEEQIAGRNIREVVVELLEELQAKRQPGEVGGTVLGLPQSDDTWSNPRYRALYLANNLDGSIETAAIFAPFLTNADGVVSETALQILSIAIESAKLQHKTIIAGPRLAKHAVAIAETYELFINPVPAEQAVAEPELETVQ